MKKLIRFLIAAIVAVGLLSSCYVVSDAANAARGISRKTLDADNVIYNYEHFFDLHAQAKNGVQAANTAGMGMKMVKGDEALNNKVTEFNGAINYTRTVVEQYNADSKKINRTLFKDWRLPASLDLTVDVTEAVVTLQEF